MTLLAGMIIWNCESKPKTKEIGELTNYTDMLTEFSIDYPENWYLAKTTAGKRFLCYTSKAGMERFRKYDPEGMPSAKIELVTIDMNDTTTLQDIYEKSLLFEKDVYTDPETVTIDGIEAKHSHYTFELEDGVFHGDLYVGAKDTTIATVIMFECFSNTYEHYKQAFDKIIENVKLAHTPAPTPTDTVREEAPPPSETMKTVSGEGFTIKIPENFDREGGYYLGQRRGDSYIKVDVMEVKENTNLEKTVKNTQQSVNGSQLNEVTLSGKKGFTFAYTPRKNIRGEMYFILDGKKLYRITINWYKPEADKFAPIFRKCVQSFKLK